MLDRRPVTDGRVLANADFTDKTISMTEMNEEAVVSKTARVVEEIGLHKEASDRVETVRDTLRKDDVEVEQVPTTERLEPGRTATTPSIARSERSSRGADRHPASMKRQRCESKRFHFALRRCAAKRRQCRCTCYANTSDLPFSPQKIAKS